MGQTWTTNVYQQDHAIDTDMTNIETDLATLKSTFSGTSAPPDSVEGQQYHHSTWNHPRCKVSGMSVNWRGIMVGENSNPMWHYTDSTPEGWVFVAGLGDKIIAIKGGSTYTTGGATAGNWTINNNHNHQWFYFTSPGVCGSYASNGNTAALTRTYNVGYGGDPTLLCNSGGGTDDPLTASAYTSNADGASTSWRPAAAVGSLYYIGYN